MATQKRERQKANRAQKAQQQRVEAKKANVRQRAMVIGVVVALALLGLYLYSLSGDDNNEASTTDTTPSSVVDTPTTEGGVDQIATEGLPDPVEPVCPEVDGSSPRTLQFTEAPAMCIDPTKAYSAAIVTSLGDFTIELDPERAPATVNSFVFLARYHYFDDDDFHRVLSDFVIQGGDPVGIPQGTGGPGYTIVDELPKEGEYKLGSVVMARPPSSVDSAGSQFFVVTGDQGIALPAEYALFGQVTTGLDVALAIQDVATGAGDAPVERVTIESVTINES